MLHRKLVKPASAATDDFPTVAQHSYSLLGGLFVKFSILHSYHTVEPLCSRDLPVAQNCT
jgi:hypothetical protein